MGGGQTGESGETSGALRITEHPMSKERIITIFGSSRPRADEAEYDEARSLGKALAKNGFAICTGGYGGVMEAASRGAKEAGGKTYGVTAEFFRGAKANAWVDVEVRMQTWEQRLFELVKLGDGFAACKGGTGTLVELAVVWEMRNKSVMAGKPIVALGNFWAPVLERVREVELGAREGSSKVWAESSGRLVKVARDAADAAQYFQQHLQPLQ
jgi:uncharacterized protein (TIGR00725 family)